jgi:hypothetical protein
MAKRGSQPVLYVEQSSPVGWLAGTFGRKPSGYTFYCHEDQTAAKQIIQADAASWVGLTQAFEICLCSSQREDPALQVKVNREGDSNAAHRISKRRPPASHVISREEEPLGITSAH